MRLPLLFKRLCNNFLKLKPFALLWMALVFTFFTSYFLVSNSCWAGAQQQEALSDSVRAGLHHAVSDVAAPEFLNALEGQHWLNNMSPRLQKYIPDQLAGEDFLRTVHYEAVRAGLDPQLVLALIQVESGFRKYAVSSAGARGFMQVMPFWVESIGLPQQNLFHLRTNLRFGCTILRHYLDIEHGNLNRALGRYNGSLNQQNYANSVIFAWRNNWAYR